MNILPKKRWHVRTKDNIARVRRDEAAAREDEQKRQQKLDLAESEVRINFLRRQSGLPIKAAVPAASQEEPTSSTSAAKSVDLFADYKTHIKSTNKDLEKEQKDEQEKYEKQIGYLTYLGQDTNEALKVRSWYEVAPKRSKLDDPADVSEKHLKQKLSQDPLTLINALIPPTKQAVVDKDTKKTRQRSPTPENASVSLSESKKRKKEKRKHKKQKKHKSHKSDKTDEKSKSAYRVLKDEARRCHDEKLAHLRRDRLRREEAERKRQEALFAPKESATATASVANTPASTPRIVQKYNSQFNPEYAKQNML